MASCDLGGVASSCSCLIFWPCLLPVVPLNIGLLNVLGRKMTMAVLQLLAALCFMLLNICSTM